MAKIVKTQTQEVEIGLGEVINLIKKNWNLLADYIFHNILKKGKKEIVRTQADFNLTEISKGLRQATGLIIDANELKGAITDIFREIGSQNPHFKNMQIGIGRSSLFGLFVSFDIDVAVTPVMPVDPLDIELDDQTRANPNRVKQAEIMQLVR